MEIEKKILKKRKEKRKSVKLTYTGFILVLFDLSPQHKNFLEELISPFSNLLCHVGYF